VWTTYSLDWQVGDTRYRFTVSNPNHRCCGIRTAELDGVPVDAAAIPLMNDGREHEVAIVIGSPARAVARGGGTRPVTAEPTSARSTRKR
jgi:hypothetical protein